MDKVKMNLLLVIAMVVASIKFPRTTATDHYVGNDFGWAMPENRFYYDLWSLNQHFKVNDVLVFKFDSGVHTVAEVRSLEAFDACDGSNPIQLYTAGPARVSISNGAINHYYICTIGTHCAKGQKFILRIDTDVNNSTSALHH